jgi:hypothetical protein
MSGRSDARTVGNSIRSIGDQARAFGWAFGWAFGCGAASYTTIRDHARVGMNYDTDR